MDYGDVFNFRDENNNLREAKVLNIVEVDSLEYVVCSMVKDDEDYVFALKLVKDDNGNDVVRLIDNDDEKMRVYDSIRIIMSNLD